MESGASFHTLVGDTAKGPNGVGFSLIPNATAIVTAPSSLPATAPAVDFSRKSLVVPDSPYFVMDVTPTDQALDNEYHGHFPKSMINDRLYFESTLVLIPVTIWCFSYDRFKAVG